MPKRSVEKNDASQKGAKKQKQSSLSGFFSISSSSSSSSSASKSKSSDSSKTISTSSSSSPYKIFCDLDGVLVDFDAGIKKIFNGKGPDDIPQSSMWAAVCRTNNFYETLPWTADGKQLWDAIKHTNPDILTGVPMSKKSREEKALWCKRELSSGAEKDGLLLLVNHVDMAGRKKSHEIVSGRKRDDRVNVITCWSRNKYRESGEKHVLIDDRESLADEWEKSGGIFIHHTSTKKTLEMLKKRGILLSKMNSDDNDDNDDDDEVIVIEEKKKELLYDLPPDTP